MPDIRPFNDPSRPTEPCRLEVATHLKPLDHSITLANVTLVTSGNRVTFWKHLITARPMTHDEVVAFAIHYANEYHVPVIFEKRCPIKESNLLVSC